MGSEAALSPKLGQTIHICGTIDEALALDPPVLFSRGELLAIDGIAWQAAFDTIRSGLDPTHRDRKEPWTTAPIAPAVDIEVHRLRREIGELFDLLYPGFNVVNTTTTFRPMVTGPEPMHFDTKVTELPMVTAFVNVARTPRVYRIGPSFQCIMAKDPQLMRDLSQEAQRIGHRDVSFLIRRRGIKALPPLGRDVPKHDIAFAPGSIWFFDAKTVSHEVIYGEGAVHVDWTGTGSGAWTQQEMLMTLENA